MDELEAEPSLHDMSSEDGSNGKYGSWEYHVEYISQPIKNPFMQISAQAQGTPPAGHLDAQTLPASWPIGTGE